jgi:2-methylcitrate dehydratase PrpD
MATTTAPPAWPQPLGSDVKEGIPWGVVTGIAAAALAEAGMTGPLDLVDHAPFFDKAAVLAARPSAAIAEAYTKFYAACRHCHAPVDAFLEVVAGNRIALEQIDTIHVGANSGALRISNNPAPRNLIEAQYSIPYCLGLVAADGVAALLSMTEASLGNTVAEAVARKVSLSVEPDCEARFPAETVVRVSIAAGGRTYTSETTSPRGEASQPPSWDERLEKFDVATASRLGRGGRGDWRKAFGELKDGRLGAVRELLSNRLS